MRRWNGGTVLAIQSSSPNSCPRKALSQVLGYLAFDYGAKPRVLGLMYAKYCGLRVSFEGISDDKQPAKFE
jgi:hypothetical protein